MSCFLFDVDKHLTVVDKLFTITLSKLFVPKTSMTSRLTPTHFSHEILF